MLLLQQKRRVTLALAAQVEFPPNVPAAQFSFSFTPSVFHLTTNATMVTNSLRLLISNTGPAALVPAGVPWGLDTPNFFLRFDYAYPTGLLPVDEMQAISVSNAAVGRVCSCRSPRNALICASVSRA